MATLWFFVDRSLLSIQPLISWPTFGDAATGWVVDTHRPCIAWFALRGGIAFVCVVSISGELVREEGDEQVRAYGDLARACGCELKGYY